MYKIFHDLFVAWGGVHRLLVYKQPDVKLIVE